MKVMFLLGAGASVDAGLPTANNLTNLVLERLETEGRGYDAPFSKVMNFVVGRLLAQQGDLLRNPLWGTDIERVVDALSLLADRKENVGSAFHRGWHPLVEELDQVGWNNKHLTESAGNLWKHSKDESLEFGAFKSSLKNFVDANQFGDGHGTIFKQTISQIRHFVAEICVVENSSKVQYLNPLSNILDKQSYIPIASLNYDNCIELSAKENSISVYTGFEDWKNGKELNAPKEGYFLIKPHGSYNWEANFSISENRERLNQRSFDKVDEKTGATYPGVGLVSQHEHLVNGPLKTVISRATGPSSVQRAIILGGPNKLTVEGPYLDLLLAFKQELSKVKHLVAVGYSFRDSHVNEFITHWLNGSTDTKVSIVSPSFSESTEPYAEDLRKKLNGRLNVISEKASTGLDIICKEIVSD